MGKLFYDITLEKQYNGPDGKHKKASINIPHFQKIKDWLPLRISEYRNRLRRIRKEFENQKAIMYYAGYPGQIHGEEKTSHQKNCKPYSSHISKNWVSPTQNLTTYKSNTSADTKTSVNRKQTDIIPNHLYNTIKNTPKGVSKTKTKETDGGAETPFLSVALIFFKPSQTKVCITTIRQREESKHHERKNTHQKSLHLRYHQRNCQYRNLLLRAHHTLA